MKCFPTLIRYESTMARKIFTVFLIYFSALLILLSVAGIGLIWTNNTLLTRKSVSRMEMIDSELTQAQTAIRNARGELERTLRIVEGAEKNTLLAEGPD